MIKKIIAGFLLGFFILLFWLQNDPWFKRMLEDKLQPLISSTLEADVHFKIHKINLLSPSIVLTDIAIRGKNNIWSITCETISHRFAWWHFLSYGIPQLHIDLTNLHITTRLDNGKPAIINHIIYLLEGPIISFPRYLKEITGKSGSFAIDDTLLQFECPFYAQVKQMNNLFKAHVYLQNGSINHLGSRNLSDLQGHLQFDIKPGTNMEIFLTCACTFYLPQLKGPNKTCFLTGLWENDQRHLSIKSADDTIFVEPVRLSNVDGKFIIAAQARCALAYLYKLCLDKKPDQKLRGNCTVKILANLADRKKGLHGHAVIKDVTYGHRYVCSCARISFSKNNNMYKGGIYFASKRPIELKGMWQWHEQQKKGLISLYNNNTIELPANRHWQISEQDLALELAVDNNLNISGTFQAGATNIKLDSYLELKGSINGNNSKLLIDGSVADYTFNTQLQPWPLRVLEFICQDKQQETGIIITADQKDHDLFSGSVGLSFIKKLVKKLSHQTIEATGECQITGKIKNEQLYCCLQIDDSSIRLPHLYNIINQAKILMQFDSIKKKLFIKKAFCKMHRGTISCSQALCYFDSYWNPEFLFMPICFDRCFLSLEKTFFSIASANVVLKKQNAQWLCKGTILFERTQLKENIFSLQLPTFLPKIQTDNSSVFITNLLIETKEPIRIKTPVVQAQASLQLHVQGPIKQPTIDGSILLHNGSINFPYRPLYLSRGSLEFIPEQGYDPVIELIAKNNIKKHAVSLYLTGSIAHPHLLLEATPALTEEQIIGLLLVGSHEQSLNMAMPALVMQNIQNFIFRSAQSPFRLDRYFNSMFQPFKHIHLVPSFSDQTGRGGLRGTIEFTIGERWRALIQKNFSLSEDTKLEVEYLLSDDMSVRAFRNERRDVGAEFEMRWKF